jgi:CheY-like chemotaxis protein
VFSQIAKTNPRVAAALRRVLIVDPHPASAKVLGEMLRDACQPEICAAPSGPKALKIADKYDPQLIFCELAADKVDGVAFTRALRRSDLGCRKAPVILVTGQATAASILAGRDAGAHEFLRKPFTTKDLARRLEVVTLQSRSWVEAIDYVGPDRRRFNSAEYQGPHKRMADRDAPPQGVRIVEALKIVRSALSAIDREPAQALRSLLAQTTELELVAAEISDNRLAMANAQLHRYLFETASFRGALDATETLRRAQALLNYAGRESVAA